MVQRGTESRLELVMGMDRNSNSPFAFYEFPCGSGDNARPRRSASKREISFCSEEIHLLVVELSSWRVGRTSTGGALMKFHIFSCVCENRWTRAQSVARIYRFQVLFVK